MTEKLLKSFPAFVVKAKIKENLECRERRERKKNDNVMKNDRKERKGEKK